METPQNDLSTWAIVELFGHQKIAGYLKTQAFGTSVMFRVDVPELPEREYVLEAPQHFRLPEDGRYDTTWCQAGTKVQREKREGFTKFYGPGAVYCLSPCDELTAMRAVESLYPQAIKVISAVLLPRQIDAPQSADDFDDDIPI